ncbi:MAG: phosphopantetheine-binding protein [Kangiellaceae bacterium]|nr:phosphopantetheine-binding protein [Kangiellaceae bacterium]
MEKEDIFKVLVKHVEKIVFELFEEAPIITDDTYFCELGASSCDRAVIVADTLNTLSVNTPVEEILVASTIGEMVELIYKGSISNNSESMLSLSSAQCG